MIRKLNQEEINNIAGGMILEMGGLYLIAYTGNSYPSYTRIPGNFPFYARNNSLVAHDENGNEHVAFATLREAQMTDRIVNPQNPNAGRYLQRSLGTINNETIFSPTPELIPGEVPSSAGYTSAVPIAIAERVPVAEAQTPQSQLNFSQLIWPMLGSLQFNSF